MKRLVILSLMIGLLVSCSPASQEETKEVENYPLTGLEAQGEINRPVAVMVNNQNEARPQSGLSQADLVIEALAEGNITRFMAIYQSEEPDVVGPVRSAREYFFDLAKAYDAIYVYHGSAKFIQKILDDSGVDYLNGAKYDDNGVLFKRESFRRAPHNSYLQYAAVFDQAEKLSYDLTNQTTALPFIDGEDLIGESVTEFQVPYSSSNDPLISYKYDSEQAKYSRFEKEQTVELDSDEPVLLDNVFVIEAKHSIIDDEGRRFIDLTSGGKGMLFQKGKAQKVDWINEGGKIIPVKEELDVGFIPGKTWINIIPDEIGIDRIQTNFSAE